MATTALIKKHDAIARSGRTNDALWDSALPRARHVGRLQVCLTGCRTPPNRSGGRRRHPTSRGRTAQSVDTAGRSLARSGIAITEDVRWPPLTMWTAASSSAGCSAVYSDIVADEVGIHIRPDAFVGVDQLAGPLFTDLSVVEDLTLVVRCVRVGLGNLLFEPLVQRLVLPLRESVGSSAQAGNNPRQAHHRHRDRPRTAVARAGPAARTRQGSRSGTRSCGQPAMTMTRSLGTPGVGSSR